MVASIEARQGIFIRMSFGEDLDNPEMYDLTLNTDFLEVSDAVDIIMLEYARKNKYMVHTV